MISILTILVLFFLVAGSRGELLSNGEDVDAFVNRHIMETDVMVFAKSFCPYCRHTRQMLAQLYEDNYGSGAWTYNIIDIDQMGDDGPTIQMELLTKTGQKTVPSIFIHRKHIGGDSDLTTLYVEGKLEAMLYGQAQS